MMESLLGSWLYMDYDFLLYFDVLFNNSIVRFDQHQQQIELSRGSVQYFVIYTKILYSAQFFMNTGPTDWKQGS